jgi:hypothetical protein
MKFIKNINDENYKYIDGRSMDIIMGELFGNDRGVIEVPRIRDSDLEGYFNKLKDEIESMSDVYLKEHKMEVGRGSKDGVNVGINNNININSNNNRDSTNF